MGIGCTTPNTTAPPIAKGQRSGWPHFVDDGAVMNVEHLKKQAKALVKIFPSLVATNQGKLSLHDAQQAVAALNGYPSWTAMIAAKTIHPVVPGKEAEFAYQIRITLNGTQPSIWRLIEVPASYTFWDLHVAIQDAMGWLDYHLHEFTLTRNDEVIFIGIPDETYDVEYQSSWEVRLHAFFGKFRKFDYHYDFGDSWHHTIHVEGVVPTDGKRYPRCVGGENACPPEDCGGTNGFTELKELLTGPKNAEFRETRDWLKNRHAKCYWPYDPLKFDIGAVKFDEPAERLEIAFQNQL
jgi:hypothetical protein